MKLIFLGLAAAPSSLDVWDLVSHASGVVLGVMGILAVMSVIGWYVIGYKYFYFARAIRQSEDFEETFWRGRDIGAIASKAQQLRHSPLSAMFLAGYSELGKLQQSPTGDREGDLETIERSLMKTQLKELVRLESMVPFLATTGSAGPFIGLFGTVWGIMNSFRAIGAMKTASVANVAPGIAEALIATAIGLVAAIPAVMGYNYFQRKIRVLSNEMETFSKDFLNIVRRHFLK